MAISKKLLKHLDAEKVKYGIVEHKTVYTAYDLAQTLKKKLEEVAKAVVIVADKQHVIVVLPGNRRLDFSKLKKALNAKKVDIAKEATQKTVFKVKQGAITAFGVLYHNTPVLLDKAMLKAKNVLVGSGSFEHALSMSSKELMKAAGARLADISEKAKAVIGGKKKKKVKARA